MVALQQVQCLEEVVRTKSFRAAAAVLHLSQPAVSGHIARLERELNLTLLTRAPGGSVLTADGVRILPHLRAFVETTEQIRRASDKMRDERPQQSLTIVGETRRLHPALPLAIDHLGKTFDRLSLRIVSADADSIGTDLRAGRAELGIYGYEHGTIGLADDIESIPIFELGPAGVALPPGHPLLDIDRPIELRELRNERVIILTEHRATGVGEGLVAEYFDDPASIVDGVGLGLDLVRHGFGVMPISAVTAYVNDPDVRWRQIADSASYSLAFARLRSNRLSPVATAFVEFMREWCASCPGPFSFDAQTGSFGATARVDTWMQAVGAAQSAVLSESVAKFSK